MQKITSKTVESVIDFLQKAIHGRGFKQAVVGLSGGIDSAVVALLCKKALGENIKAIFMPSLSSSESSITDSLALCKQFDIAYEIIPIKNFDKVFCEEYPNHTALTRGNFCARMRMATLYHVAAMENRLVIGTSNKTELMLGYGTIFGDLACAINPVGSFYKMQIYQFARLLGVPQEIINKPPSADLYAGQSDEKELGYSYAQIDMFLESYEECSGDKTRLMQYPRDMLTNLISRIERNAFKRVLPEIFNPQDA